MNAPNSNLLIRTDAPKAIGGVYLARGRSSVRQATPPQGCTRGRRGGYKLPGAIIALNMEKSFDRVSWDFLHTVLDSLGFGEELKKWMNILYDHNNPQKRTIVANGFKSQSFQLGSGVAQGCPLSPLLFLCVAEALTRAIKENRKIKGIMIDGHEP